MASSKYLVRMAIRLLSLLEPPLWLLLAWTEPEGQSQGNLAARRPFTTRPSCWDRAWFLLCSESFFWNSSPARALERGSSNRRSGRRFSSAL